MQFIDSITGKLNILKTTWEQVITNIFLSESVKGFIDGLTKVIEVVANITSGLRDMNLAFPAFALSVVGLQNMLKFLATYGLNLKMGVFANAFKGSTGAVGALAQSIDTTRASSVGLIATLKAGLTGLLPIITMIGAGLAVATYQNLKKANSKLSQEMEMSIVNRKDNIKNLNKEAKQVSDLSKKYVELSAKEKLSNKEQASRKEILNELSSIDESLVNLDASGEITGVNFSNINELKSKLDKELSREEILLERDINVKARLASFDMSGVNNETDIIQWVKNELHKTSDERVMDIEFRTKARVSGLDLDFTGFFVSDAVENLLNTPSVKNVLQAFGVQVGEETTNILSDAISLYSRFLNPALNLAELGTRYFTTGTILKPSKENSHEGRIEKILNAGISSQKDLNKLVSLYGKVSNDTIADYEKILDEQEEVFSNKKSMQDSMLSKLETESWFSELDSNKQNSISDMIKSMSNIAYTSKSDQRTVFDIITDSATSNISSIEDFNRKLGEIQSKYQDTGDLESYNRSIDALVNNFAKANGLNLDSAVDKIKINKLAESFRVPEIDIKTSISKAQMKQAELQKYKIDTIKDLTNEVNGRLTVNEGLTFFLDVEGKNEIPSKLKKIAQDIQGVIKTTGRDYLTAEESTLLIDTYMNWSNGLQSVDDALNKLDTKKLEGVSTLISDLRFNLDNGINMDYEKSQLAQYISGMTGLGEEEVIKYIDFKIEDNDSMKNSIQNLRKEFAKYKKSIVGEELSAKDINKAKFKFGKLLIDLKDKSGTSKELKKDIENLLKDGISNLELDDLKLLISNYDITTEDYANLNVRLIATELVHQKEIEVRAKITNELNQNAQETYGYETQTGYNEHGIFQASVYKKSLEDKKRTLKELQNAYGEETEQYKNYQKEIEKIGSILSGKSLENGLKAEQELKTKSEELLGRIGEKTSQKKSLIDSGATEEEISSIEKEISELIEEYSGYKVQLGVSVSSVQEELSTAEETLSSLKAEREIAIDTGLNTEELDKQISEVEKKIINLKKQKLTIEIMNGKTFPTSPLFKPTVSPEPPTPSITNSVIDRTQSLLNGRIVTVEAGVEVKENEKEGLGVKIANWFKGMNPFMIESEAKEPTPEELALMVSNAEANTPALKIKSQILSPSEESDSSDASSTVSIKTQIDNPSKKQTQSDIDSIKQTSTPSISVNPSPAKGAISGVRAYWDTWSPAKKTLNYEVKKTETTISSIINKVFGKGEKSNMVNGVEMNSMSTFATGLNTPEDAETPAVADTTNAGTPSTFASSSSKWTAPVRVHNKVVDYLVYGVELTTELENKIKTLTQQLDLLDAKMEHAFGTKKINYMKEQIKLLEKQKQLQNDLIKQLESEQVKLKSFLSTNGFKFDADGGVTNYVAKLMEMNRKLDTIKSEKEYEKYKNNLDELTKALERYLDITFNELPDAVIEWEDLENQIKDVYKEQLEIAKETEEKLMDIYKKQIDEHKEMLEKQTEDTIKALEKRVKAEVDAINEIQEAYNKARDEEDYQEELADKREALSDIERQIALASRDTSTAGKAKLEKLMEEYDNLKDDLDDFLQDREDKLVNDLFDDEKDRLEKESEDEIDRLEKELEEALKKLEDTYTEEKLMEMIKDAIASGQFTGIDGSVSDLNEVMLQFLNSTSEGLGATGQIIKNEWIGNLEIAKDVLKDIDNIVKELELDKFHDKNDMFKPETFTLPKQQSRTIIPQDMNVQRFIDGVANSTGKTVNFNQPLIQIAGNVTEEVMPKLEKFAKEVEKRITNNIVYAMR